MTGNTIFLDLPEPLLAFRRKSGDQQITCVFNLSKDTHVVELIGDADLSGPHSAALDGPRLMLPGNGFAYLHHNENLSLSA